MRGKKDVTTFPDKPVSWIASLFRFSFIYILLNSLQVKTCRALYDNLQRKNSILATPQRIFLYHRRTTSYNALSKNRAVFTQSALESLLLPQPWYEHPLQRHIQLQVYQEPPADRRVKGIWRRHAKDDAIDEIHTSKQPFSQQTQRHQTHKKRNQATHRRWQNNELLHTKTVNIQRSTRTKAIHSGNKNETGHRWQGGHHS